MASYSSSDLLFLVILFLLCITSLLHNIVIKLVKPRGLYIFSCAVKATHYWFYVNSLRSSSFNIFPSEVPSSQSILVLILSITLWNLPTSLQKRGVHAAYIWIIRRKYSKNNFNITFVGNKLNLDLKGKSAIYESGLRPFSP